MVRAACCPGEGVKKGAWTSQEDKLLSDYILAHGLGRWRNLPRDAGLNRCPKSCRLRWLNYLRPDIKRGNITEEEEDLIIRLHNLLGNRWSLIAGRLPGRTDNEIKNYWNTCLRKKSSGDFTKNHRGKPKDEECHKQKFASSIVRTKAVRCTRLLFKNEDATTTNNSLSSSNPSSQVGSGLHPSLYSKVVVHEPRQLDIDGSFVSCDTKNFPPSDRENIFMMGNGSSRASIFTDTLGESWYDLRGIDHVEEEILQYLTEDSMLQDVISRH